MYTIIATAAALMLQQAYAHESITTEPSLASLTSEAAAREEMPPSWRARQLPQLPLRQPSPSQEGCSEWLAQISVPCDFASAYFDSYAINSQQLPLILSAKEGAFTADSFNSWIASHREELTMLLEKHGALLLRRCPLASRSSFPAICQTIFQRPFYIDYEYDSTSQAIASGLYTYRKITTLGPQLLANALSDEDCQVSYVNFYCETAPERGGGEQLLAPTERLTEALASHPQIWELFAGRNLRYTKRYPMANSYIAKANPLHKSWQELFATADRNQVEMICHTKGFEYCWKGDWLEVYKTAPAIRGPDNAFPAPYWYNQAHLYAFNARICGNPLNYLLAETFYCLSDTRPFDVEFADDGSSIPQEAFDCIYDMLEREAVKVTWEDGDLLLIDNVKVMHGCRPSNGDRQLLMTLIE